MISWKTIVVNRGQAPSLFDPRPVIATVSEANAEAEKQDAKNNSEDKSQEVAVSIEEVNDLDKKRSPQELFKVKLDCILGLMHLTCPYFLEDNDGEICHLNGPEFKSCPMLFCTWIVLGLNQ